MKVLVLYVYHEINNRVRFFLKNAVFSDPMYDFIFIANGCDPIDVPSYVKTFRRPNVGLDFGGWSEALLTDDLYKNYTHFIFVNSSVYGPFIPMYHHGIWPEIFLQQLTDDVRIVGTSICNLTLPSHSFDPVNNAHVQSMVFVMERECLEFLITVGIFSMTHEKDFFNVVVNREIRMSREIIKHGWNIGCLLTIYKGVDFRFIDKKPSDYPIKFMKDVAQEAGTYLGSHINPFEVIFVKGNHSIPLEWLLSYAPKKYIGDRESRINKITSAIYGNDVRMILVIDILKNVWLNGKDSVLVSNHTFGMDPCPNMVKTLKLTIGTNIKIYREGETLDLSTII